MDNVSINSSSSIDQLYTTVSIISSVLSCFGLVFNSILLYIFITDGRFRLTSYSLLCVCITSDFISNVFSFISNSLFLSSKLPQPVATLICQLFGFVMYTSYGISIMNLCLISIDRYFTLVKPHARFYRVNKNRVLIISQIMIFCISIATAIPVIFFLTARSSDHLLCDFVQHNFSVSIYLILMIMILYLLPSLLLLIVYGRIIAFFRSYIRPGESLTGKNRIGINKTSGCTYNITKTFIAISLSYTLVTLPFFILLFALAVAQKSTSQLLKESEIMFWLAMIASSCVINITVINPILYLKFDNNIRKSLIIKYHRFCQIVNYTRSSSTS